MSDKWMSIAEAAASLKVHPRTIERRIAGGKVQSRRADDGVLQVLIPAPDIFEQVPDNALETVRELAADQVSLATGSASALVRYAQNDAAYAREELAFARQDAGRARRSALAAWCVVALAGVGAMIAVGWTTQKMTRAGEDVRHLSDYVAKMEKETQKLVTERDSARQEAQIARVEGAEASGKLTAYQEQVEAQLAARPTTRPASLMERLANAFSEQ